MVQDGVARSGRPDETWTVYLITGSGLGLLALIAFLYWYFTPSLSIETPTAGAALCEPIAVKASWTGRLMSMTATLNGTDVKNVPLTLDNGAKAATATTEADAGTRILTVVAEFEPPSPRVSSRPSRRSPQLEPSQ